MEVQETRTLEQVPTKAPIVGKYKFLELERPELFVENLEQLEEAMKYLESHEVLGVDTEFLSNPFYRPNLEVLQISSPEVMMAIDVRGVTRMKLDNLLELLLSKELIIHSCQSDMQIIYDLATQLRLSRRTPRKVFDTQIACAFLQPKPMMAFKQILETYFGVTMDKTDTLSDWSRRPFTTNQIKYAINDVRHLHQLRAHLLDELQAIGRKEWCLEEMECLTNPLLFAPPEPNDAWRGIFQTKKYPSGSKELNVARELGKWREITAQRGNRLPGYILKNESLVGLSGMLPSTPDELLNVQGLSPGTLRLHSKAIIAVIQQALKTAENSPTHRLRHQEGGRLRGGLFNLLSSRVQTVAVQQSISPLYLVPRQEIWDLASVSLPALQKVATFGPGDFQPVKMISHFMNLKSELLPLELNTMPPQLFNPKRQSLPEVTLTGHIITDPFTFEEELAMLRRLKVLSGWRRELIGNDLLAIAMGNSLAWDESSGSSNFAGEKPSYALIGDAEAQEALASRVESWVEGLDEQERGVLKVVVSMVEAKLQSAGKSTPEVEEAQEASLETVDVVNRVLQKVEGLIKQKQQAT